MLENKKFNDVHYSRFIASWRNAGGKYFDGAFEDWLKSYGLSDSEVREVVDMAIIGKLELEWNAADFIKNYKYEF